ncbi:MAG: PIG-L deacetylase family protein, partial [Tepidiformaceae bacterium]
MPNPIPDTFQPRSLMVVVAHPDDAEFMVAGTVAKWAKHGCEVTYVVVTRGDKGSDDPLMTSSKLTEIREAEQREAGSILGVRNFEFMGYPDGYLQHTLDLRRDLTRLVRKYRPEVLVTFDPTHRLVGDSYVNHPDHRATGDAAIDAVFPSARDRLTFPELLLDGLEPWKVQQLWLGFAAAPDVCVDITDSIEAKRLALAAHPSQFGHEIQEFVIEMGRNDAQQQDFEYGES